MTAPDPVAVASDSAVSEIRRNTNAARRRLGLPERIYDPVFLHVCEIPWPAQ